MLDRVYKTIYDLLITLIFVSPIIIVYLLDGGGKNE